MDPCRKKDRSFIERMRPVNMRIFSAFRVHHGMINQLIIMAAWLTLPRNSQEVNSPSFDRMDKQLPMKIYFLVVLKLSFKHFSLIQNVLVCERVRESEIGISAEFRILRGHMCKRMRESNSETIALSLKKKKNA